MRSRPTRSPKWSIPGRAHSANRNIAFNGNKMESAVERYRTNRVIPPSGIGTSGSYRVAGRNAQNNAAPVGPTVTAAGGAGEISGID